MSGVSLRYKREKLSVDKRTPAQRATNVFYYFLALDFSHAYDGNGNVWNLLQISDPCISTYYIYILVRGKNESGLYAIFIGFAIINLSAFIQTSLHKNRNTYIVSTWGAPLKSRVVFGPNDKSVITR